jgi:UDP-N-acetylmuramoylalanine--D-glutamate ligase
LIFKLLIDWSKFNNFKKGIAGKRVLILGLGLQGGGVGAVKFFYEMKCQLRVSDLKSEEILASSLSKIQNLGIEEIETGKNSLENIDWADVILVNPGVPHSSEAYKYAVSKKKTILMEEALFVSLCPVKTIGITGTRGKTTTATLIGKLLETKYKTHLSGNIPGSESLMSLFEIQNESEKVVMELSSFQLSGFHTLKVSPNISIITNIYEDHLNVYQNMDEYVFDKKAIYLYQKPGDVLIINGRFASSPFFASDLQNQTSKVEEFFLDDLSEYKISLKGDHNKENFAAALHAAKQLNVTEENIKFIFESFSGVKFRQEKIREFKGITFINDTTASTPTAAIKALEANPVGKVILLCGGNSKNCNIDEFVSKIKQNCKQVVFLKGNATEDLKNAILRSGMKQEYLSDIFDNFKAAIDFAFSRAEKGNVVLLSPGFTSFGMFNNEFERGEQFSKIVFDLK